MRARRVPSPGRGERKRFEHLFFDPHPSQFEQNRLGEHRDITKVLSQVLRGMLS
jgi:hypothetical protein